MRINFFDRKKIEHRISIEKVFLIIKKELHEKNIIIKSYENPFPLYKIVSTLFYFKKNQGDINHITGDIHWSCLLMDSNKTVLTIHDLAGLDNYSNGIKRKLYLLLWLYLPLWKLKYITAISQKTKDEIVKYYPSALSKIRVIYNPLTMEVFYREPKDKAPEDFTILMVGTRENKNIERVIESTKNIACTVIIVGKLSKTQNELINNSKAKFILKEFVSDEELETFYKTCDILCFPSLYEGFGMPIIEAQASGCAVITSQIEPMITVAGNAALFVDPYNIVDITEKIAILMNDFEVRSSLILNGYENIKQFLPEEITQQYLKLYSEILDGRKSIK